MVVLWICVGQAGLQVGAEFWKLVDSEYVVYYFVH
jgi:hypothetical protein